MLQTVLNRSSKHKNRPVASRRPDHWTLDDIAYNTIDVATVAKDENLFYLATCASFVESGSDLYTQNLVDYFEGSPDIAHWLRDSWEPEELQHGLALRRYVEHIWPDFDWETAYQGFLAEYSDYCKVELLEPTKGLEMVSRCVIETGTATFYKALAKAVSEPVFKDLAQRIARDEVGHYKHFLQYFKQFKQHEQLGRRRIFSTLGKRTAEMKSEDADCAIRHAIAYRAPHLLHDKAAVRQITSTMHGTVRRNVQSEMTIKMLLRPLDLPRRLNDVLAIPVTYVMNHLFFR